MLQLDNFLEALPDSFLEDGFSLSLRWCDVPETGYMVSYPAYEQVLESPTILDIVDYVQENVEFIYGLPHAFVGGWMDAETGKYYLDISQNIQDKAKALQVAAERKQLAIYDVASGVSIYL